jgi:methyl-accepting chemotaxis protein
MSDTADQLKHSLHTMLSSWKISSRIWIISLFPFFLFVVGASLGWQGLKSSRDSLERVFYDHALPMRDLAVLQKLLLKNANDALLGFDFDPAIAAHIDSGQSLDDILSLIKIRDKKITKLLAGITGEAKADAKENELTAALAVSAQNWNKRFHIALDTLKSGQFDKEARDTFLKATNNELDIVNEDLDGLIEFHEEMSKSEFEQADRRFNQNHWIFLALLLGGSFFVLLSVSLTLFHLRTVLLNANQGAESMAAGNLTVNLSSSGSDEISMMLSKLDTMRCNLIQIVRILLKDVNQLKQSSQGLFNIATENSNSAEQQLTIAQQTKFGIEQLTHLIEDVRAFVASARAATLQSCERSESGGQIIVNTASEMREIAQEVNYMAQTVRELDEQAHLISGATQSIQDIVGQINLLALNASIEAARAGEQGRGFAVVADEVRKLSQKTALAADEITGMISKIKTMTEKSKEQMEVNLQRVNHGAELAGAAGVSVKEIQSGAQQVILAVDNIDQAFGKQAAMGSEILAMIEQMTHITELNRASMHSVVSASQELRVLSDDLHNIHGRFSIPDA